MLSPAGASIAHKGVKIKGAANIPTRKRIRDGISEPNPIVIIIGQSSDWSKIIYILLALSIGSSKTRGLNCQKYILSKVCVSAFYIFRQFTYL